MEAQEAQETQEPQTPAAPEPGHDAPAQPAIPHLRGDFARLAELALKYPEIGPPVAELAFKTGYGDFGQRILSLGLGGESPGMEYYATAARQAKHERKHEDALGHALGALRAFVAGPERYAAPDEGAKLLHLLRLGFTTILFELKDPQAHPEFAAALREDLPKLAERLGQDPFYHTLLAQSLWSGDREASEREWDRAAELGEPEFTYNARGTWYKDAEHDTDKAERAYRQGLERAPQSALLKHNLAQLLLDKAHRVKDEHADQARGLLREAHELVRSALQGDCPKGLRRHIYATRGDIAALRDALQVRRPPQRERPPRGEAHPAAPGEGGGAAQPPREARHEAPLEPPINEEALNQLAVGQTVRGTVRSLAAFGAFVTLEGGIVGLLHKSQLAHGPAPDPATVLQPGQEVEVQIVDLQRKEGARPRIGLSRKALLPPPPPGEGPPAQAGARPEGPRPPRDHAPGRPGPRPEGRRDHREHRAEGRPEGRDNRDNRPGRPGGGPDRPREDRGDRRDVRPPRPFPRDEGRPPARDPKLNAKLASLGEMLLAKLKEQKEEGK